MKSVMDFLLFVASKAVGAVAVGSGALLGIIGRLRKQTSVDRLVENRKNIVNATLPIPFESFLLSLQNPSTLVLAARTPQRIARYHTMLRRWTDNGRPNPKQLLEPYHGDIWSISYQAALDHLCAYYEVRDALMPNVES